MNGSSHASWSYGQLAGQVRAVCGGLRRLGLGLGSTVLLLSHSGAELLPAMLGAACANVAVTFGDPDFGVGRLTTSYSYGAWNASPASMLTAS